VIHDVNSQNSKSEQLPNNANLEELRKRKQKLMEKVQQKQKELQVLENHNDQLRKQELRNMSKITYALKYMVFQNNLVQQNIKL
jgi:uncharacterized protein YlxW (UPF0749 family)